MQPGEQFTIESPNYPTPGYTYNSKCSWLVETSSDVELRMYFLDSFLIKCELRTCVHWVEVITQRDASVPGFRFCCSRAPDDVVTSDSGRLIINFRSPMPTSYRYTGFKAIIKAGRTRMAVLYRLQGLHQSR